MILSSSYSRVFRQFLTLVFVFLELMPDHQVVISILSSFAPFLRSLSAGYQQVWFCPNAVECCFEFLWRLLATFLFCIKASLSPRSSSLGWFLVLCFHEYLHLLVSCFQLRVSNCRQSLTLNQILWIGDEILQTLSRMEHLSRSFVFSLHFCYRLYGASILKFITKYWAT